MKNPHIATLRTERAEKVKAARAQLDKAEGEKRAMDDTEKAAWQALMDDVDTLKDRIDKMEAVDSAEDETRAEDDASKDDTEEDDTEDDEEEERSVTLSDGRKAVIVGQGKGKKRSKANATARQLWEDESAYRNRIRRSSPEYRAAFNDYLINGKEAFGRHRRAISADSDTLGGYMVAPQEFVGQLIKFVDNLVFVRQKATKFVVQAAQSLGAPSLDTDVADSDWTSELATGSEDSSMAFGKRELHPHPLAKRIKVSNKLLRMAGVTSGFSADGSVAGGGPEGLVRDRLGYKMAVTEEKGFLTGNGSQKPLGLFTASARGISTSADVQTGSTTDYTADGLINAKYSLKQQYQAKAEWLLPRLGVRNIRKLKDGMGQYIWQAGLGGSPDTLLDRPINVSEYVPSTFTTGQYVGIFGDFSFYWICDSLAIQIQKLLELYAEANQVGFIARLELDGMPVLEEAFARLITN